MYATIRRSSCSGAEDNVAFRSAVKVCAPKTEMLAYGRQIYRVTLSGCDGKAML